MCQGDNCKLPYEEQFLLSVKESRYTEVTIMFQYKQEQIPLTMLIETLVCFVFFDQYFYLFVSVAVYMY